MYEETLEDIYYQLSIDELIMLITSYRHDKEEMYASGDLIGADKANVTIQYLRHILNNRKS